MGKMKVWEETWHLDDEGICLPDDRGFPVTVRGRWTTREQERLAAAAPEMARALLRLEWAGEVDHGSYDGCPACFGVNPTGYGYRPVPGYLTEGHTATCPLDAALRKAGIR